MRCQRISMSPWVPIMVRCSIPTCQLLLNRLDDALEKLDVQGKELGVQRKQINELTLNTVNNNIIISQLLWIGLRIRTRPPHPQDFSPPTSLAWTALSPRYEYLHASPRPFHSRPTRSVVYVRKFGLSLLSRRKRSG